MQIDRDNELAILAVNLAAMRDDGDVATYEKLPKKMHIQRDHYRFLGEEIERLQAALRQVIEDCEVAGNLSYAARTAREALSRVE